MGNIIGHNRNLSSDRQRQTEGQEVRDQSQRPEYQRPTHQDFAYNPPRSSQDRAEQPTQGMPQESQWRAHFDIQNIENYSSGQMAEFVFWGIAEHFGQYVQRIVESGEPMDRPVPPIIQKWRDQYLEDFHSKLDPTDKPASSNSEEKQDIPFLEESNMRMIVFNAQLGSLSNEWSKMDGNANRDQEIERMMQLHNQNTDKLVEILLEERSKSGDILGRMPEGEGRAKLESVVDENIKKYMDKKDE